MSKSINPFTKLSLDNFYWQDAMNIEKACLRSDSIQQELNDIRAGGDEVELAVRNFFHKKLNPKYAVTNGHIVDSNLNVSPQLDIIIADHIKTPVLDTLADNTDLVYYESVYAFGEVKKSYYKKTLLSDFSANLQRIKQQLYRDDISANTIECSIDNVHVKNNMTEAQKRNMLFSFMFFCRHNGVSLSNVGSFLNASPNEFLPNILVFMDYGVVVNIQKTLWESSKRIMINLYPELADQDDNLWVVIPWTESSKNLAYSYLLLMEHLSCTIVGKPEISKYNSRIFQIDPYSVTSL